MCYQLCAEAHQSQHPHRPSGGRHSGCGMPPSNGTGLTAQPNYSSATYNHPQVYRQTDPEPIHARTHTRMQPQTWTRGRAHAHLRSMATSRQNWACPAGSCCPPTILTATDCTPPSSALYTCAAAADPPLHPGLVRRPLLFTMTTAVQDTRHLLLQQGSAASTGVPPSRGETTVFRAVRPGIALRRPHHATGRWRSARSARDLGCSNLWPLASCIENDTLLCVGLVLCIPFQTANDADIDAATGITVLNI